MLVMSLSRQPDDDGFNVWRVLRVAVVVAPHPRILSTNDRLDSGVVWGKNTILAWKSGCLAIPIYVIVLVFRC